MNLLNVATFYLCGHVHLKNTMTWVDSDGTVHPGSKPRSKNPVTLLVNFFWGVLNFIWVFFATMFNVSTERGFVRMHGVTRTRVSSRKVTRHCAARQLRPAIGG